MIAKLDHKIVGGKLLRVEVEFEGGVVLRARVSGDFFAHPETAFEAAEAELSNLPVDRLAAAALGAFSRKGLVLYGASAADIAETLEKAVHEAQIS